MQTVYLFLHKCAPFLLDSSCPAYGPGQDCGARAGAQAILDGQSQKILNDRAGAWNFPIQQWTDIVCGASQL